MNGKIIYLKSKKTAGILINKIKKNKKYCKNIFIKKKILAHYNCSFYKKDMIVSLEKIPNISKKKNWKIKKIIK
ncbi:30S ribosomal protein S17 [Candidatus Vidania fulgoroideorum]